MSLSFSNYFFSSYVYKYPPSRDINNYTNPQYTKLPLHRNGMKSTTSMPVTRTSLDKRLND